jgi:hypothetical protein
MAITLNGSTGIVEANIADSAITNNKVASLAASKLTGQILDANAPSGCVIQVIQTVKTDAFASSLAAIWVDITGMSVTITPSSVNSKILVTVDMKGAGTADISIVRSRLLRNSTPIYFGDAASNRPQSMGQFYISNGGAGTHYLAQLGGTFLDSPATTSAVTYKVQIGADGVSGNQIVYVNRTQGDRDANVFDSRVAATMTVMEIAA